MSTHPAAARDEQLARALRGLVRHDSRSVLDLPLADVGPWEEMPNARGSEVHDLLRELRRRDWIVGEDQGGDGSAFWWSFLAPTIEGLEHIGLWPPEGQEHLPGPWDDGIWRDDRRALGALQDSPPAGGFLLKPLGTPREQWFGWQSYERLLARGLIDGERQPEGLADVRLTSAGLRVLHPPADDPLVRARVKLRQGARADAVTAAVDQALGTRLRELAGAHGVPTREGSGSERKLAHVNNELKGRAYGEFMRAQVEAWLKVRNEINHGRGAPISDRHIALLIDGIELFLDEQRP